MIIGGFEEPGGPESISDLDAASWNPKEILGDLDLEDSIPLRALFLSFSALLFPVLTAVVFPEFAGEDTGLLIWLMALVPAFLFTYYRGWPGASLSLALGMVVLTMTQVALLVAGIRVSNWSLLAGIVIVYIATSLGIGWLGELLHVQRRKAERMALTDVLTGMPNRRHSVVFVDAAFAAAQRGVPLTVVIFDLDQFKAFNDARGHLEGDEALKRVADIFQSSTRRMNLTARWGGEEFLSILSETSLEGGIIFAERILAELHGVFSDGSVTASAGVAGYVKGMDTPARLLAAADKAMYTAKAAGGDCVRVASEGPPVEAGV
ncbi:MAG: GGDEF domain-containing protein [Longimicrobiales bacterium]